MENKEYDVVIIRRTTNCQNEDSVFSSTPTPSTGRPFPRKPMLYHTKENMHSVECVARGLDPLTTNLVVADVSLTEKIICLAVLHLVGDQVVLTHHP